MCMVSDVPIIRGWMETFGRLPSPSKKNDNGHSRLKSKTVYYYVLTLYYKVDIIII